MMGARERSGLESFQPSYSIRTDFSNHLSFIRKQFLVRVFPSIFKVKMGP